MRPTTLGGFFRKVLGHITTALKELADVHKIKERGRCHLIYAIPKSRWRSPVCRRPPACLTRTGDPRLAVHSKSFSARLSIPSASVDIEESK